VKPHPDVMFKDVCCHLSGHDVVYNKFVERGEKVEALLQLLNCGVLVGIKSKQTNIENFREYFSTKLITKITDFLVEDHSSG
jgi:hypothetical protein